MCRLVSYLTVRIEAITTKTATTGRIKSVSKNALKAGVEDVTLGWALDSDATATFTKWLLD